ncbi:cyclin domain-containing protein [Pyronema omphalodes]|nr:cyclin domain-containing protein [Pyronema omphalodes]
MQARRTARTRAVANENGDENAIAATTRLTRAKAASLTGNTALTTKAALNTKAALTTKTALATKTVNTTTTAVPANRKRAALGDVSNVHKAEAGGAAGADKKIVLKRTTKTTAAATTKPVPTNGITKAARTTRAAPIKATAKPVVEITKKPSGSGSGALRPKKRTAPSKTKEVEEVEDEENKAVPAVKVAKAVEVQAEEAPEPPVAKRPRVENQATKVLTAAEVTGWDNLDEEDAEDPLMVSEYVNEIFDYLKKLEPETQPNPNYMDDQNELKWQMRGILVDWLVEVHTRFRLLPETLFLSVNIVDRFLTNKVVMLDKLELVGVTAMFIAAKYEEVFSPHVQYFRHVADDGFTEEEILRAERFILATLEYNLSYPNPMNFLRRISKADQYDFQTRTFAKYLMEISLLDHRFLEYLPSHVSAAAMYMARMMLNRGAWDANLVHFSDYTEAQILPVFRLMIDYLIRPVKHQAFFKKYATKKFMKAAVHAREWAKKNAAAHGVDPEIATRDLYAEEGSSN